MTTATELLRRAADALRSELGPVPPYYIYGLIQEIEERFISAEPEAECSDHPDAPHGFDRNASHNSGRYVCTCEGWEPEAEPYAWAWDEIMSDGLEPVADMDRPVDNEYRTNIRPLFLHSPRPEPARKPMTEEEMDVGFNPYRMRWLADDQYFVAGVRWAEKHHGIGKDDE